jgi:hypothetical protein
VEVGAALLSADGLRDIGTPIEERYPSSDRFNLAYGAELAVGLRLTDTLSVKLSATWHDLGRISTGAAPDIGGAPQLFPGVPPVARMRAQLDARTMLIGLRHSF